MNSQDIERDAMFLAVVNSIRRDFPNSSMGKMSDDEAAQTAASWAGHLRHIPTDRLLGVYHALAIGLKFPPTISEFADTWAELAFQESQRKQDAKRQREDAELEKQSAAGTLFTENTVKLTQMSRLRWAAGLDTVCCDCTESNHKNCYGASAGLTKDGKYFCCQSRQCNFREPIEKLMEIRTHPKWQPVAGGLMSIGVIPQASAKKTSAPKIEALLGDDELIENLESRCRMNCEQIGTQKALAFGRALLKKHPILMRWDVETARIEWKEFIAEAA